MINMQRKPTKNTRGPNTEEKTFQGWVKRQPCIWCGSESGSVVDHVKGSTFKHNKTLIGHWFVLPNCEVCDHKKTIEGKKLGDYVTAWIFLSHKYEGVRGISAPSYVWEAIESWGGTWQNGRL
jgi:hypothetical protein